MSDLIELIRARNISMNDKLIYHLNEIFRANHIMKRPLYDFMQSLFNLEDNHLGYHAHVLRQ